jgi:hypothetical protein
LAAGTAAITGTAPVLREVGGPEAWYADPADHEALAEMIHRASDTITTDEVRRRRRQWTRQFSWDQSAQTIGNQIRQLKNLTS